MRKYRQPGYEDKSERSERRQRERRPRSPSSREGPRSPRMTGFHKVVRCAMCGATLPASDSDITYTSSCLQCSADLHTCRNCVHFDPTARFECSEPISERIPKKDMGNLCDFFETRTAVEKVVSSKAPSRNTQSPEDPREAFERLFKK